MNPAKQSRRSRRYFKHPTSTKEPNLPYLYIDKVFHELRDELLSAMHAAVQSELRGGRVDVARLYRSFSRAAAKQMANPAFVSDKCIAQHTTRKNKGASPEADE